MNQINVIHPYLYHGQWVFDDVSVGLDKEAFVAGADTICNQLLAEVGNPGDTQFTLIFSKDPFPGFQRVFSLLGGDSSHGGHWYHDETKQLAWLCPALLKYFADAPHSIHVEAKAHEVIFEQLATV